MRKSTILVTGAAGYIGSHFCAELSSRNLPFVGVDNLSRGRAESIDAKQLIVVDIDNGEAIENICRRHGVDTVVHFAAFAYVGESGYDPALYYKNNISKGIALIEAARSAGVRKFVFSSSCTTYGTADDGILNETVPQKPENPYGDTKVAYEILLKNYYAAYGMRYAILRYFNAAGAHPTLDLFESHNPESHLIPLAIRASRDDDFELAIFGNDYATPDGTCVRDYVHVSDLADAHLRALDFLERSSDPIICNLGIGRGYSVLDVIRSIEKITGRKVKYGVAPRRVGDAAILVADARRASEMLGWKPKFADIDSIIETALRGDERAQRRSDPDMTVDGFKLV